MQFKWSVEKTLQRTKKKMFERFNIRTYVRGVSNN